MGCDIISKQYPNTTPNAKAYYNLISLMLSSQTKDEITFNTMKYLIDVKGLSIRTILDTNVNKLN